MPRRDHYVTDMSPEVPWLLRTALSRVQRLQHMRSRFIVPGLPMVSAPVPALHHVCQDSLPMSEGARQHVMVDDLVIERALDEDGRTLGFERR